MSAPPQPRPGYRSLFSNRSFSSLWSAQIVSESGDALFDVALLWLVYSATNSTILTGITQAAVIIPSVFAYPIAGVYADRRNRRNIMIVANLWQGLVTAAFSILYYLNTVNVPIIIVLVLLLYTGAQFYRAANSAMIPRIVSRENLATANGLFTLSTSTNQLLSYTIGGLLIAALGGVLVPISYDSLTFFAAAILLTFIARSYGAPRVVDPNAPTPPPSGFRREFREGLGYVRQSKLFQELIVFAVIVNFFGAALGTLFAPYSKTWLVGGGPQVYGFILSSFALGLIVGSITVGRINTRKHVGKFLFLGVTLLGISIGLAGLVTQVYMALPLIFVCGFLSVMVNVPLQVMVQTTVPGEMLGRAATVMGSLAAASTPFAAVFAGVAATYTSIGLFFTLGGIGIAVSAGILYFPFSQLRKATY